MDDTQARAFGDEWINAWNSHDLDRILAHYHQNVTLSTPFIARLLGHDGPVVGREALRAFWGRALERFPDLSFFLYGAYAGADSVVLHYRSVQNLAATEFLRFDRAGRVIEVVAHYRSDAAPDLDA